MVCTGIRKSVFVLIKGRFFLGQVSEFCIDEEGVLLTLGGVSFEMC